MDNRKKIPATPPHMVPGATLPISLFVWLWLVITDRKFSAGTVFFSHTNQPVVLLHEPATKRTSQPNRLNIPLGLVAAKKCTIAGRASVIL